MKFKYDAETVVKYNDKEDKDEKTGIILSEKEFDKFVEDWETLEDLEGVYHFRSLTRQIVYSAEQVRAELTARAAKK